MSASNDQRKAVVGLFMIGCIVVCYTTGLIMIFESELDPIHASSLWEPGKTMSVCGFALSVITLIYLR